MYIGPWQEYQLARSADGPARMRRSSLPAGRLDLELDVDEPETPETCDDEETSFRAEPTSLGDEVMSTLERRLADMDGSHVDALLAELHKLGDDSKLRKSILLDFFKQHMFNDDSEVKPAAPKQAWRVRRRMSSGLLARKSRVSQLSKEAAPGLNGRKRFGTTGALPRPAKSTLIEMRRKQFYEGKETDLGDAMDDHDHGHACPEEKDPSSRHFDLHDDGDDDALSTNNDDLHSDGNQSDHGLSEAKDGAEGAEAGLEAKHQEILFEAPAILPTRPALLFDTLLPSPDVPGPAHEERSPLASPQSPQPNLPRLGGPTRAVERVAAMEPLSEGWPSAIARDLASLDIRSAKAEPDVADIAGLDIPRVDSAKASSPLETTEEKVDDLIEWTQTLGMQSDDESLFDDGDEDDLELELEN